MVKETGTRAPFLKNGSIVDFFKPFAKPPPSKRHRDEACAGYLPLIDHRRSKSPRFSENQPFSPGNRTPSLASSTSALTPLGSDETIEAPLEAGKLPGRAQSINLINLLTDSSQSAGSTGSTLSSSRRVVKNGEAMVKNSDEEFDSDSSLEDPEELLKSYGIGHKSSPLTEPDLSNGIYPAQRVTRSMDNHKKKGPRELPPVPKYKFSLGTLVAKAEKDDAAEAGVEQALQLAEELDRKRAALLEGVSRDGLTDGINSDVLASVMKKEDPDDIGKLMQAIQRTEALQFKKSWYFLDSRTEAIVRPEFPSCRGHPIARLLASKLHRDAFIVSGYLGDLAAKDKLPWEVYEWILDSAPVETREDFRKAGLVILQNSSKELLSTFERIAIERVFCWLGLSDQALNTKQPINPVLCGPKEEEARPGSWDGLEHTLRVIGCIQWVQPEYRPRTFGILCRVGMDSLILAKAGPLFALKDAISMLINNISPDRWEQESRVLTEMACHQANARSYPQKVQLLRIFPASTAQLCDFRKQLAVSTLVKDSEYLRLKQTNPLTKISDFTQYLQSESRFAIQPRTDYSWLTAIISILDIALDDGRLPENITEDREVEKEFNKQVDELSSIVKSMFTKILDTGASHMTRTEAKEVLEALHARLEYAIRTKPKQKASLFGDLPGSESKSFMSKFLGKPGAN